MPNMTAGYGCLSDLMHVFCEFSYITTCLKCYSFHLWLRLSSFKTVNDDKKDNIQFFFYQNAFPDIKGHKKQASYHTVISDLIIPFN